MLLVCSICNNACVVIHSLLAMCEHTTPKDKNVCQDKMLVCYCQTVALLWELFSVVSVSTGWQSNDTFFFCRLRMLRWWWTTPKSINGLSKTDESYEIASEIIVYTNLQIDVFFFINNTIFLVLVTVKLLDIDIEVCVYNNSEVQVYELFIKLWLPSAQRMQHFSGKNLKSIINRLKCFTPD